MTRKLLQQLTKLRLKESKFLLDSKNFSGAYYLAGYVIELSLKACISRKIKKNEIPDKKLIQDCYTHDLNNLVKLADLEQKRKDFEKSNSNFAANWAIVKDWKETSRYEVIEEIKAKELFNSITPTNGGVLKWIQQYW